MIDDAVHALATGKNFAVLTTLMPSGYPQSQVMWIDADAEHILINTEVHRQKFLNLERDPRATVTIIDASDPYHYAEIRGRVVETVRGEKARAHVDVLSEKYTDGPYDAEVLSERVILKIAPDRVRMH